MARSGGSMSIFLKEIDNSFDKDLLKLFENCKDYFELVEGEVPKNTDDFFLSLQIGRASCRERVCQYV